MSVAVGVLLMVAAVTCAPAKTYNQRQEGELNIHAELQNIVVVLIPTSNLNLLSLASKTKYPGDKAGFLQFFQKPHIDRFETVDDADVSATENQNDIKTEITTSQQVVLNQKGDSNEDKEEEVVAKVEEMKNTEKKTSEDSLKTEVPDVPVKEHSTVSETTQELVFKITDPKEEETKLTGKKDENAIKVLGFTEKTNDDSSIQPKGSSKKEDTLNESVINSSDKLSTASKSETSQLKKEESSDNNKSEFSELPGTAAPSIKDLIRPVAPKEEKTSYSKDSLRKSSEETSKKSTSSGESVPKKAEEGPSPKKTSEPVRLESARREKVIRYKPESKWAPGLVELVGPAKPKPRELEERQRFATLCSPGTWDSELKTCIMPGETRSRSDLARFLEAMRFGIALPAQ